MRPSCTATSSPTRVPKAAVPTKRGPISKARASIMNRRSSTSRNDTIPASPSTTIGSTTDWSPLGSSAPRVSPSTTVSTGVPSASVNMASAMSLASTSSSPYPISSISRSGLLASSAASRAASVLRDPVIGSRTSVKRSSCRATISAKVVRDRSVAASVTATSWRSVSKRTAMRVAPRRSATVPRTAAATFAPKLFRHGTWGRAAGSLIAA